jgi:hypothetical protein
MAEDCLPPGFYERLLWRKLPLKSSTPESPIAVIQILNVIGCKVPKTDFAFFIGERLQLYSRES